MSSFAFYCAEPSPSIKYGGEGVDTDHYMVLFTYAIQPYCTSVIITFINWYLCINSEHKLIRLLLFQPFDFYLHQVIDISLEPSECSLLFDHQKKKEKRKITARYLVRMTNFVLK